MKDYTEEVYVYLRSLPAVDNVVVTAVHPWLMKTYGLTASQAQAARQRAMQELHARGLVERLDVRSRRLRLLG